MKEEYVIIDEIGSGGMATVYKAVQKALDRLVAIKELKKSYLGDDQIVKRFERESRVAASLQHENIVHIYDYWKKPHYAIVMEYVDGATLAEVIGKTGALPVDVSVMIAIQVSNALEYAHMRGLVHRDIKPGNIMIKRNGEVKLMDFGIAHTRSDEALTVPGMLLGTPAYMSPEQILGQELDVRSDIFSFGIVLYEMFTGIKPFSDDDTKAVTARIVKDAYRAPRRVNSEIPWRLHWLIKKCLRKKPGRRHQSMLDVERKLGIHLAGRTTKAASLRRISEYLVSRNVFEAAPEQDTVIVPPKPSMPLRIRIAYATAALAVALAAGAAAISYYGPLSTSSSLPAPDVRTLPATTVPAVATRPESTLQSAKSITPQDHNEMLQSVPLVSAASETVVPRESGAVSAPASTAELKPHVEEVKHVSSSLAPSVVATAPTASVVSASTSTGGKAEKKSQAKKKNGVERKKKKPVPAE